MHLEIKKKTLDRTFLSLDSTLYLNFTILMFLFLHHFLMIYLL